MMVRENHHHFLIITVRVWINPRGKLPTDEFGTGLIEKLVSRGALRHPCLRNFSTIGGELAHDLLVEPNVHFRRAFRVPRIAKFFGEFLSSGKTAVEVKQLQQINNRLIVVELLLFAFSKPEEYGFDIDGRRPLNLGALRCRPVRGSWCLTELARLSALLRLKEPRCRLRGFPPLRTVQKFLT